MAGQSVSTLSALLKPNVRSEIVDTQFRKVDFLDLLRSQGRVQDSKGPAPFSWNITNGTNTSVEVFAEGQAPPVAGKQVYVQTSLGTFGVRDVIGETRTIADNRAKQGYWTDPFDAEKLLGQADLFYKIEGELMGSTADRGIASILTSTGTYANVAQSSYSVWASFIQSTVGALTVDSLQTTFTNLTSGVVSSVPRGAMPTHVLMPVALVQSYANTVGPGASSGSLYRIQSGQGLDAGVLRPEMSFNGMPIVRCRQMTAGEIYMVDITDYTLLVHRDLVVDPIVGNPEMEQYQLSTVLAVQVLHRNWHGRMTGVT